MSADKDKEDWLLKISNELQEKLDTLAVKRNISGRAPWAIVARQVLAEAVEGSA